MHITLIQFLLSLLPFFCLFVLPFWLVFRRAGFSGAWSLLALLPIIGLLIVAALLSFRRWPAQQAITPEHSA